MIRYRLFERIFPRAQANRGRSPFWRFGLRVLSLHHPPRADCVDPLLDVERVLVEAVHELLDLVQHFVRKGRMVKSQEPVQQDQKVAEAVRESPRKSFLALASTAAISPNRRKTRSAM